jgi:hypothetical protein
VLLMAGWWALRAPTIEHRAVAPPPEIDIDPPAMRARREAVLALATMPDDPWSFAEALAASAPTAAAPRQDCGIEGRPTFAESDSSAQAPVQTGGASSRYAAAQARVDAALRSSADPLDRAVADWLNVGGMRSEAGRDEAVVQQAAATADARLYAFAYGLCHGNRSAAPSCRSISLERWIQIDSDNGIPWVAILEQAQSRGDAQGVGDAMSHLASARRFDTYAADASGVVARRAPKDDDDLAAVNDLSFKVVAQSAMQIPAFQPLVQACRDEAGRDAELLRRCQAISDVMFAHSDNLISQAMSGALLFQATGEASRRDFIRAERALAAAHWSPATGFSECGEMRDSLRKLVRMAQVGEVEAMRERARQFVTP